MNNEEYERLKATMPWRHEVHKNGKGALIKLLDKDGQEVPLISLVHFMEFITGKIAQPRNKGA